MEIELQQTQEQIIDIINSNSYTFTASFIPANTPTNLYNLFNIVSKGNILHDKLPPIDIILIPDTNSQQPQPKSKFPILNSCLQSSLPQQQYTYYIIIHLSEIDIRKFCITYPNEELIYKFIYKSTDKCSFTEIYINDIQVSKKQTPIINPSKLTLNKTTYINNLYLTTFVKSTNFKNDSI